MKVNQRIKYIRENKRLSQEAVAFQLELSQSQYSRRENGEIPFTTNEIETLADILDVKIAELYGEETIVFNNKNQKGGSFGQFIAVPDLLIEQYEARLKEKERIIQLLEEKISSLVNLNK